MTPHFNQKTHVPIGVSYKLYLPEYRKWLKKTFFSFFDLLSDKYEISFTISSLLLYLGFKTDLIVVDYNGTILQKEFWHNTQLKTNDNIEILTIAGGG